MPCAWSKVPRSSGQHRQFFKSPHYTTLLSHVGLVIRYYLPEDHVFCLKSSVVSICTRGECQAVVTKQSHPKLDLAPPDCMRQHSICPEQGYPRSVADDHRQDRACENHGRRYMNMDSCCNTQCALIKQETLL
jgi:hypothetical protein